MLNLVFGLQLAPQHTYLGAENFALWSPCSLMLCTLPYQKYSYTTKYSCTDCAIYRLNIQFGARWELKYSGVHVIASRILHENCLLIGELAIRRTNLTLIVRSGT